MSSLSPETRALIDAAGDADRPTAEERARVRHALVQRLGVGTAVVAATAAVTNGALTSAGGSGTASALGAASAGGGAGAAGGAAATMTAGAAGAAGVAKVAVAATTSISLAVKIAGAAVVASAVAFTAVSVSTPEVPVASPPSVASRLSPSTTAHGAPGRAEAPVPATRPAEVQPLTDVPSTAPVPLLAPEQLPNARPEVLPRTERAADPTPAITAEPATVPSVAAAADEGPAPAVESTIAAETALLRRAHALLVGGDATGALALLDEHARTFPSGSLIQEREAERVAALCAAGQVERARAEATTFIAAHPGSPLASRVRRTCETR